MQFSKYYHILFLQKFMVFAVDEQKNICIAGFNRQAGCATGVHQYYKTFLVFAFCMSRYISKRSETSNIYINIVSQQDKIVETNSHISYCASFEKTCTLKSRVDLLNHLMLPKIYQGILSTTMARTNILRKKTCNCLQQYNASARLKYQIKNFVISILMFMGCKSFQQNFKVP